MKKYSAFSFFQALIIPKISCDFYLVCLQFLHLFLEEQTHKISCVSKWAIWKVHEQIPQLGHFSMLSLNQGGHHNPTWLSKFGARRQVFRIRRKGHHFLSNSNMSLYFVWICTHPFQQTPKRERVIEPTSWLVFGSLEKALENVKMIRLLVSGGKGLRLRKDI